MYRVEFANDRHDWILKSWEKTRPEADAAAEKISQSGYTARIIRNGCIIHYVEKEEKCADFHFAPIPSGAIRELRYKTYIKERHLRR